MQATRCLVETVTTGWRRRTDRGAGSVLPNASASVLPLSTLKADPRLEMHQGRVKAERTVD